MVMDGSLDVKTFFMACNIAGLKDKALAGALFASFDFFGEDLVALPDIAVFSALVGQRYPRRKVRVGCPVVLFVRLCARVCVCVRVWFVWRVAHAPSPLPPTHADPRALNFFAAVCTMPGRVRVPGG